MGRMSEEDKLRRRIAAGAGVDEVERLLALLKAKEAKPRDPRRAKAKVPRCWRRLSLTDLENDIDPGDILREDDPHHGLGDPRPRHDDRREIHGRFPDGKSWILSLESGNQNYWAAFKVMDEEGGELYEDEGTDLTGEKVEALVRVPDPECQDERDMDEVLRYVLDLEWVPDAEPYVLARVEYDPDYVGGGYSDVGEFAWVPFDPWFDSRGHEGLLDAFERLVDLPRSCVIAADVDDLFVRSGDRTVPYSGPQPSA